MLSADALRNRATPPGADQLLTIEQLADRLQVPTGTVRKWRAQGTGPKGIRVGRFVRYRPADVDAWLDTLGRDGY